MGIPMDDAADRSSKEIVNFIHNNYRRRIKEKK